VRCSANLAKFMRQLSRNSGSLNLSKPFKSRYSRLGSKIINFLHFLKDVMVAVPPSSQAMCSVIKMEYIHLSTERGTL